MKEETGGVEKERRRRAGGGRKKEGRREKERGRGRGRKEEEWRAPQEQPADERKNKSFQLIVSELTVWRAFV